MGEIPLEQLCLTKFALEIKQGSRNESLDESFLLVQSSAVFVPGVAVTLTPLH